MEEKERYGEDYPERFRQHCELAVIAGASIARTVFPMTPMQAIRGPAMF
jgi:hypothetical protein